MPRKPRTHCAESIYHIYNRCINQEWFGGTPGYQWRVFETHLMALHYIFDVKIHAFVMMQNHYHLMAQFPQSNMSRAMQHFGQNLSHDLRKPQNRINRIFSDRYKSSLIGNCEKSILNLYKYIYLNPVKAGICSQAENYRYSTLNGLLGYQPLRVPMTFDSILFGNSLSESLRWINDLPAAESYWDLLSFRVRQSRFRALKDPKNRRLIVI